MSVGQDGMHSLIWSKSISGFHFAPELMVSHLLFADDSLTFCGASLIDCYKLKEVFESYSAASGCLFNFDKSSILFDPSARENVWNEIKCLLGLTKVSSYDKYLGLPSGGRQRRAFLISWVTVPGGEEIVCFGGGYIFLWRQGRWWWLQGYLTYDVDIADVEAFSLSGRFAKEIGLSPSTVELYFCVLYNILWDNKVRIQSYCGSFLKFNTC